jgi:DeoR family transcriptional regulator of aga operon
MKQEATADEPAPTIIRRSRLLQEIVDRGFLRVADASVELGVSAVTVRSDLSALELAGSIVRVHGGAMPRGVVPDRESSFEKSLAQEASAKSAIGRRAASLVSSGDSVLLDVGTTALAVAHALVARRDLSDVVVVTNGLSIALALEPALPRFEVIVTGGTLRPLQHSLVNPYASSLLDSLHVDIAFIGCNGVDPVAGVTNVNLPEAEVKARMLRSSTRHVVIADASKVGRRALGLIGGVGEFDTLVTSGAIDADVVAALAERGLTTLFAD